MPRAKGKRPKFYDRPTRCLNCEHINISKIERGLELYQIQKLHCYKCRDKKEQKLLNISILNAIKMITKERYAHDEKK